VSYNLSTTSADLLDEFLATERPKVSKQGYTSLQGLTRRMLQWFDNEDLDLFALTISDAVRYQAWLADHRQEDGSAYDCGTIHNYLKTARKFFAFLVATERLGSNPFDHLRFPRLSEHLTRNVLTEAQMGRLLAELGRFAELPDPRQRLRRYRVHVIAEFLYATGLRIAEACTIVGGHLDLEQARVYLPEGKGGKARTAFLTRYAVAVLTRYLATGRQAVLGNYPRDHADTIFGADKARVAAVVNAELDSVCTSLGLPVITTHGFRHSLGTHLLRAGCDMRHIQVILGHEALQTTQIYTRVDKDDLKRSLDSFHPRQWQAAKGQA
jgi:integrase/recombinase XerD